MPQGHVGEAEARQVFDEAAMVHRLVAACKAVVPVVLPLMTRVPGRPPTEETPEGVLKSERRREVMRLIRERPGISQLELRRELDLSHSSLQLHLDLLILVDLVEVRRVGRFVRVWPYGMAPPEGDLSLMPESTRRIARLILQKPRSSAELAEAMGFAQRVVQKHIRILLDAGLVAEDKEGRNQQYVPTDQLLPAVESWQRK